MFTYFSILKINPNFSRIELPAGLPVEFLVGFRNKGEQDFIVESLRASFRYPMDFNFYIQNFSAIGYNKEIASSQEATFAYSFIPAEAFAGRPFGLNINLAYRDAAGNSFQEAIFNETVQIIELEEGKDQISFRDNWDKSLENINNFPDFINLSCKLSLTICNINIFTILFKFSDNFD